MVDAKFCITELTTIIAIEWCPKWTNLSEAVR